MLHRPTCIGQAIRSIAVFACALFLACNPVSAASDSKNQCIPHTAVTKAMIVASLSDSPAPAERISPPSNLLEKQTVAPRSQWIRVAPLVTKVCCGGYSCNQQTGTCVCKKWC